jgi:cupin-like protein
MNVQATTTHRTAASFDADASTSRKPARRKLLNIDEDVFRTHFDRKPFMFGHNICNHPLLTIPRLTLLAKNLRDRHCEYNAGTIPVSLPDWANTPHTGLSMVESLEQCEKLCSWMVLKRTETYDPEYRAMLDELLDEMEPLASEIEPGMYEREAAIFVSSPNAITPYHIDHEVNFLLQICGRKSLTVFHNTDRTVLTEKQLEDHFYGPGFHRNLPFREEWQSRGVVFEMKPGDAVHVPTTCPHWVRNGDRPSVSLSVSFKTDYSQRRASVYKMNARLRRLGIDPHPFGRSPMRDTAKFHAFRALRRAHLVTEPKEDTADW